MLEVGSPWRREGNLQFSECQFWEVPPWRGRSFFFSEASHIVVFFFHTNQNFHGFAVLNFE